MKILFGVPSAGAGPREFEKWPEVIGGSALNGVSDQKGIRFQVVPYQKEFFHKGDFIDTMDQAARAVCDKIGCKLEEISSDCDEPIDIYMFGHCMGASVAYEAACLLAEEKGIHIKGLFVSAFISPDVPILDGISHLDDDAFLEEIHSHGTFPEEFFINKSLSKLFLPRIKADYRLIENYVDIDHVKLDCPIVGFFGEDDQMVTADKIEGWNDYTTVGFEKYFFPGNHYFYYSHQEEIIDMISSYINK